MRAGRTSRSASELVDLHHHQVAVRYHHHLRRTYTLHPADIQTILVLNEVPQVDLVLLDKLILLHTMSSNGPLLLIKLLPPNEKWLQNRISLYLLLILFSYVPAIVLHNAP